MRPVIALTATTEHPTRKSAQSRDFGGLPYSAAVRRAGGAPVLIPPSDEKEPVRAALSAAGGLLITGGKDICPAIYGEETLPFCGAIDPARDSLDRWVIEAASDMGLPVLAVCRGIQALAAFLGGSLYQDIEKQVPGVSSHRQDAPRPAATHDVGIAPGSVLARVIGEGDLRVNSFHHQAIKGIPSGFRVSAHAPDGIIEALEAEDGRFWLGVQWHPEEMAAGDPRQQALFAALVEEARTYCSGR